MKHSEQPSSRGIRLNRYLAECGIASRRKAEALIQAGKIKVNGKTVTALSTRVTASDTVKYNGQTLKQEASVYLMLNKPKDTLTTKKDHQGRKKVFDLLTDTRLPEVFAVGRLDRNTSGILILTNDGELANRLMHPKRAVEKGYQITLDQPVPASRLEAMAQPQYVDDDYLIPESLAFADFKDRKRLILSIHSGQNRIVRRMLTKWGYRVKNLDRISYAGLGKNSLKPAQWRHLKKREVNMLKNKAGL